MAVQSAAQRDGWTAGAELPDRLTPRQAFCGPLLSALLFGGGGAGISDVYVHIRDIVPLSARDWGSHPVARPLPRWRAPLPRAISDFARAGVLREAGHPRSSRTDKGLPAARGLGLSC